jgi:hypothetical protein
LLLAAGLVVAGLGVLMTLLHALAGMAAGVVLLTIGFFVAHSVASGWVGRMAAQAKGHAASLYLLAYYAGSSVMGSVGGWAWTHGGCRRWRASRARCSPSRCAWRRMSSAPRNGRPRGLKGLRAWIGGPWPSALPLAVPVRSCTQRMACCSASRRLARFQHWFSHACGQQPCIPRPAPFTATTFSPGGLNPLCTLHHLKNPCGQKLALTLNPSVTFAVR